MGTSLDELRVLCHRDSVGTYCQDSHLAPLGKRTVVAQRRRCVDVGRRSSSRACLHLSEVMRIALIAFLAAGICALALKIVISEYEHGRERFTDSIVIALGMSAFYFMILS